MSMQSQMLLTLSKAGLMVNKFNFQAIYAIFMFWKNMNHSKNTMKQKQKFVPQYNQAIIRLIKHKFLPLQRSKASIHRFRNSVRSPQSSPQTKPFPLNPQTSFPSLPTASHHSLHGERPDHQMILLERAKQYIGCHRKGRQNRLEKVELKQYIELFEKPIELNGRGKRGSIQFNLMDVDTRQRLEPLAAVSTNRQQLQLNQDERSIMNAKIRRKLNHRKIIDLAKRL